MALRSASCQSPFHFYKINCELGRKESGRGEEEEELVEWTSQHLVSCSAVEGHVKASANSCYIFIMTPTNKLNLRLSLETGDGNRKEKPFKYC